jgi:hypothetical protein
VTSAAAAPRHAARRPHPSPRPPCPTCRSAPSRAPERAGRRRVARGAGRAARRRGRRRRARDALPRDARGAALSGVRRRLGRRGDGRAAAVARAWPRRAATRAT